MRIGAAEGGPHVGQIWKGLATRNGGEPGDGTTAIRDDDFASLLHIIEQIRQMLPCLSNTSRAHATIVTHVAQFVHSLTSATRRGCPSLTVTAKGPCVRSRSIR